MNSNQNDDNQRTNYVNYTSNDNPDPFAAIDQPPLYDGPKKHSGPGIASFILSLVAVLVAVVGISMAATPFIELTEQIVSSGSENLSEAQTQELLESNPGVLLGIVMFMASGGLAFLGFVLGLVGCFMKNRRKIFAILGTVITGVPFLAIVGLFIYSLVFFA